MGSIWTLNESLQLASAALACKSMHQINQLYKVKLCCIRVTSLEAVLMGTFFRQIEKLQVLIKQIWAATLSQNLQSRLIIAPQLKFPLYFKRKYVESRAQSAQRDAGSNPQNSLAIGTCLPQTRGFMWEKTAYSTKIGFPRRYLPVAHYRARNCKL